MILTELKLTNLIILQTNLRNYELTKLTNVAIVSAVLCSVLHLNIKYIYPLGAHGGR